MAQHTACWQPLDDHSSQLPCRLATRTSAGHSSTGSQHCMFLQLYLIDAVTCQAHMQWQYSTWPGRLQKTQYIPAPSHPESLLQAHEAPIISHAMVPFLACNWSVAPALQESHHSLLYLQSYETALEANSKHAWRPLDVTEEVHTQQELDLDCDSPNVQSQPLAEVGFMQPPQQASGDQKYGLGS